FNFEFVSYRLSVHQGGASSGEAIFEFTLAKQAVSLSVFDAGRRVFTWRGACAVKRRSDLECALCAIGDFLGDRISRLGNAVGTYEAMGSIFEQCLREAREGKRFSKINKGELTLSCPYLTCYVHFYDRGTFPLGKVKRLRVGVPNAFLPYLFVGWGFELVTRDLEPITQVLETENFVDACARCLWDGFEFYLDVGRVHRELLTSFARDAAGGLLRLSNLLRKS
ncbi:MAG: hypothetical protein DRP47_12525, partial [Candidatus Zixiibacteriota bacterium]